MPPKRQKEIKSATSSKKSKTGTSDSGNSTISLVESLISDTLLGQTYCEELGINLSSGSNAVFQWLACSSMFGSRLSEVNHLHNSHHACWDLRPCLHAMLLKGHRSLCLSHNMSERLQTLTIMYLICLNTSADNHNACS